MGKPSLACWIIDHWYDSETEESLDLMPLHTSWPEATQPKVPSLWPILHQAKKNPSSINLEQFAGA